MIAESVEKERLDEILYHYSHCVTAMDDVKELIIHKKEVQAINKLRDIKENFEVVGKWLKGMKDQIS